MKNKIVSINQAAYLINKAQSAGKTVVLCHGVFDLLHIGHIYHFRQAKSFGDILIVSLTPDKYVNKGSNRPKFNTIRRKDAISELSVVDFVVENKWPDSINIIKILKPNFYCKGQDYKNFKNDTSKMIGLEKKAIQSIGGKLIFTNEKTFSSSNLINNFFSELSTEQATYIKKIKSKYSFNKIKNFFNKLDSLNLLLIGESIVDEYVFCETLGKSGKEPVLVLKNIKKEKYPGGAVAIARSLGDFVKSINFKSVIGAKEEYKKYIESNLPKNCKFFFIKKTNSPTILKSRFVDIINKNKLLGIYNINDNPLNENEEKKLSKNIKLSLNKINLIIVSDFGHGFITKKIAKQISSSKKFIALNAQINSSNIGYNSIEKYKNINFLIINETELRYQLRDKNENLKILIIEIVKKLKLETIVVTSGSNGATLYDSKKKKFYLIPAFASKVVDKIGSGDTMLSMLSICLKIKMPNDLALFISSLAAAESVENMGNSLILNKLNILKKIEHILK